MEGTLTEIVRRTEGTDRLAPESALAKAFERGLLEDLNNYREGGLKYPDGHGGVKDFSQEAAKHICAGRIYAGIMRLARHGITAKAIQYAAMFDKEFTLEHAHINEVYVEDSI
jgi:hypothetical protein